MREFNFSKVKKANKAKSLNDMYAGGNNEDGPESAQRGIPSRDRQYYPLIEKSNPYEAKDVMYPEGNKLAYGQNKKQKEISMYRKNGLLAKRYVPNGNGEIVLKDIPISLDHIPDKYLNSENFSSESDPYNYRSEKLRSMEEAFIPRGDEMLIPNYPDNKIQLPSGQWIDPNEKTLDNYESWRKSPEIKTIKLPKNYKELIKLLYKKI